MNIKSITITSLFLILLAGCGKQTAPPVTPEQPADVNLDSPSKRLSLDQNNTELDLGKKQDTIMVADSSAAEMANVSETVATAGEMENASEATETASSTEETTTEESGEPTMSVPIPAGKEQTSDEGAMAVATESEEPASMQAQLPEKPKEVLPEPAPADSSWQLYMIAPGDFLVKIAKHEYGDWMMWRKIYNWNHDAIGDNPNLIFPYHNLDLLKPREEVDNCEPEYDSYTVKTGDNLWNIAGRIFHDEHAWIVIFWDNEDQLDKTNGVLKPGMVLKVRNNCIPVPG